LSELSLSQCGLNDKRALTLLTSLNLPYIDLLDLSYNPLMTSIFYKKLNSAIELQSSGIRKLSLEGNKIGDKILGRLVKSLTIANRIIELNVSKNEI
jgi:hypothetical protein